MTSLTIRERDIPRHDDKIAIITGMFTLVPCTAKCH